MKLSDLSTPSLVVDTAALEHNLATMAKALPGPRLRPHVKATKCTALAKRQAALGHVGFCCATVREMEGMAAAGLGADLLLANETLDARRLGRLDARVTVAVDSPETIDAAAAGGVREVLVDVNVGLPRCGCAPEDAGRIADLARRRGLGVRGVMGYEGHVVGLATRAERKAACATAMAKLRVAHEAVGGDVVSAGGTGTFDVNDFATEIQAGSYSLMDTFYAARELPFRPAFFVWSTVLSRGPAWLVCDAGLKSLGMDHGNPAIDGAKVWFCSDEHVTFSSASEPEASAQRGVAERSHQDAFRIGGKVRVWPAHIDPTLAYHDRLHLADGESIVDVWPIDLRGW